MRFSIRISAVLALLVPLCMCAPAPPPSPDGGHVHADGTRHAEPHAEADGSSHSHAEDSHAEDSHAEDSHAEDSHEHAAAPAAAAADDHDDDGHAHRHEAEVGTRRRLAAQLVHMHREDAERHGIRTGIARSGRLASRIKVNGEININHDTMVHIVPRLSGIVTSVAVTLGDSVRKGDVLAVLDSLVLADAKADYLAALERLDLAQAMFDQEQILRQQKVSSENEYLNARQLLSEARINLRSSKQKLLAMGLAQSALDRLGEEEDASLTQYRIVAPFAGTIIKKHITLGEFLQGDSEILIIADLDTVWLDLQVHQKDLAAVRIGQSVHLVSHLSFREGKGVVSYIGPLVGTDTRTALARLVLPNLHGDFRPGLFVQAEIMTGSSRVVLVNRSAVQYIEDVPCVFVPVAEGFAPRPITLGASDQGSVEVLSGLSPEDRIVTENAFSLKAELEKSAVGDGHGHAHSPGEGHTH